MTDKEFNEHLQAHFDEKNSVGLGEMLLFGKEFSRFVESDERRNRVLNAITKICGYRTSARDFAKMVSYEEFRKLKGIGEVSALGLRLFLLYSCGVDWQHPERKVTGIQTT